MDGQRQRSGGGRRRRRKNRSENRAAAEPILIVARRPNSPLIVTSERGAATAIAPSRRNRSHGPASAPRQPPAPRGDPAGGEDVESLDADKPAETPAHAEGNNGTANGRRERSARIVQITRGDADGRERERLRLMDRLMCSETRGAITRAANEYASAGFEFPAEQSVQLQLLEHFDEDNARDAIEVLKGLLESEAPLKRPIMEQRLRRLEEYAEEPATRAAAAELRRAIRA